MGNCFYLAEKMDFENHTLQNLEVLYLVRDEKLMRCWFTEFFSDLMLGAWPNTTAAVLYNSTGEIAKFQYLVENQLFNGLVNTYGCRQRRAAILLHLLFGANRG